VLSDQRRLEEAIESFLRCLRTWERTGYSLGIGLSYSNLGRAFVRRGDWQEGLRHLQKASEIFDRIQSKGFLTQVYQRLAEAYLGMGQLDSALGWSQRSLHLAVERGLKAEEGTTRRIMGQAFQSLGKWKEAEESLDQSRRILKDQGATYEYSQTLWQLALLYAEISQRTGRDEAKSKIKPVLEEALAIFHKLGVKYDTSKADELRTFSSVA
jgi:tetratricopeptide (TPR) repeat protein